MADLSNLPTLNVKIIFAAHFVLMSTSMLAIWYPWGYLFYNFILIFTLLWSIHKHDSDEPIQVAIFVNGVSVLFDIIVLAMYFPTGTNASFFGAFAIIHLLLRPVTCLFLVKILQERISSLGSGTANLFGGQRNQSYEDMDKNAASSQSNQGGYNFQEAQQI